MRVLMTDCGSIKKRFWSKVDRSGGPLVCWPFLGAVRNKYGAFALNGKTVDAHRVAWILEKGPIPPGQEVLHHCDIPLCCNYEKCLFLGTQADNMRDMCAKGRHTKIGSRGALNRNVKLTAEQVVAIRAEYQRGSRLHGSVQLAAKYGVTSTLIQQIVRRNIWRHVA
jgi:hypothetical protein